MFTIRPTEDGRVEVVDADGSVVYTGSAAEAMAEIERRLAEDEEEAPEAASAFDAWLAPLDSDTSDGRRLASEGYSTREMPLPLMWQTETAPGHDGATLAGRIEEVYVEGGWLRGRGQFDDTPEGREAIEDLTNRISEDRPGGWFGISIDPAVQAVEFECSEEDEDGFCLDGTEVYVEWELMGATGTPFPAFADAGIRLAEPSSEDAGASAAGARTLAEDDEDGDGDADVAEALGSARSAAQAAAGALGDGENEVSEDALDTARDSLGEAIDSIDEALGMVGADEAASTEPAAATRARVAAAFNVPESLIASGSPETPPAEWFTDPGLDGPTPLTIDDDGRVYGHLATWGTCHIGRDDVCLTPPDSPSGYAYFRTGETRAACEPCEDDPDGLAPVPTGTITLGTGHADLSANPTAAMEHYDDTGAAVADVAAGEDEHGVWVAGALRRGVTEDQVAALRGSSLSGDWRRIGGSLELVAALAVNVPGFPIPRSVAASGGEVVEMPHPRARSREGRQTALVAAAPVRRTPEEEATISRHPVGLSDEDRRRLLRVERALAPTYAETLRSEVHSREAPEEPAKPISLDATKAMRARRASAG